MDGSTMTFSHGYIPTRSELSRLFKSRIKELTKKLDKVPKYRQFLILDTIKINRILYHKITGQDPWQAQ